MRIRKFQRFARIQTSQRFQTFLKAPRKPERGDKLTFASRALLSGSSNRDEFTMLKASQDASSHAGTQHGFASQPILRAHANTINFESHMLHGTHD